MKTTIVASVCLWAAACGGEMGGSEEPAPLEPKESYVASSPESVAPSSRLSGDAPRADVRPSAPPRECAMDLDCDSGRCSVEGRCLP